jgi:hypothetical protein
MLVQLVNAPEDGVPSAGVVKDGLVESTTDPEPVDVVTPVPPLATGKVPVTPVVSGKPVAFVSVPLVGVPKTGVTSVGEVERTTDPDPVDVVTPVPPLATGSVPVKLEIAVDATFTKSDPFQATTAFSPDTKVTPVVGPAPTILTDCDVEVLLTMM